MDKQKGGWKQRSLLPKAGSPGVVVASHPGRLRAAPSCSLSETCWGQAVRGLSCPTPALWGNHVLRLWKICVSEDFAKAEWGWLPWASGWWVLASSGSMLVALGYRDGWSSWIPIAGELRTYLLQKSPFILRNHDTHTRWCCLWAPSTLLL